MHNETHAYIPPPKGEAGKTQETKEVTDMTATQNFFDQPANNSNGNTGLAAGFGGLIGAALGENGLFGGGNNKTPAVTPDQLGTAINGLQGNLQRDQLQEQISNSTAALGLGIGGVERAIASAASANALATCGLGNTISQGFAATNFNIQAQGAASRELALQQALDAERAKATEYRIALSEARNDAGHTATRVLLQQVINTGSGTATAV